MTLDFTSHPSELVGSGEVKADRNKKVDVKQLREAIPPHCFEPSNITSLSYLARDLFLAGSTAYLALCYIPLIENSLIRWAAWAFYGWLEGLFFTGLWVLGHESGHGAFSKTEALNHIVGFTVHSALMTPFYAWRSTHRRHHIYANNLAKDHNYVPPQREEYLKSLLLSKTGIDVDRLEELSEDAPFATTLRIICQQLLGWPWYMFNNITASSSSLPGSRRKSNSILGNSHFAPNGALFRPEEFWIMLLSDIGLATTAGALFYGGTIIGHGTMAALYLQPYLWLNHWIVAITYLHHTHPDLPKYDDAQWSFIKGATATVDREMGFIGRHLMHNVVEYHVIHHLFSRIPFYRAEEATKAIMPLLGDAYHEDKQRSFIPRLWESFTKCQYVEPDSADASDPDRAFWYKAGPSPPPEISMNVKGWVPDFSGVKSSVNANATGSANSGKAVHRTKIVQAA